MSQRLHDLLPMVERNAPPMRVTPDDILARGRRRKRNRRAATGASALTALAVAGVLVASNLPGAGGGTVAAEEQVALSVAGPFEGTIAATEVAGFTISETARVTGDVQIATITTPQDAARAAGLVALFRPGVFSAKTYTAEGQEVEVNGNPGWYLPEVRFAAEPDPGPALVWEYAEDAYALVGAYRRVEWAAGVPEPDPSDTTRIHPENPIQAGPPWLDKDRMVAVAEAVRTTAVAGPVRAAVKLAEVPSGWTLDAAGTLGETYRLIEPGSFLRLVEGSPAGREVDQLRTPVDRASVEITVVPHTGKADGSEIRPGEIDCPKADWCQRLSEDGTWFAGITATPADGGTGSGISQAELKSMLREATVADPLDRSTWFPVTAGT